VAIAVVAGAAGILGLVIGSFLNVVVYRVPAGLPLTRESRCPRCDAPVRWYQNVPVLSWLALRGRCAHCKAPISARYPLVELMTGLVFAWIAVWWVVGTGRLGWGGPPDTVPVPPIDSFGDIMLAVTRAGAVTGPLAAQLLVLAAYLWFAASGIALTLIDLDTRRLPHSITGSALFVCLGFLVLACVLGADWWALARAVLGAAALYLFYALLRAVRPDGMGGGDVRLAAVIGLMLAWLGWWPLAVGAFMAFLLGGVFGIALIVSGRSTRRTAIPFGPWIVIGAWIGIVAGELIGRSYVSLVQAL
jgi:prepilin signal peptidase PulO-like enzyme (type II secretory pathway)